MTVTVTALALSVTVTVAKQAVTTKTQTVICSFILLNFSHVYGIFPKITINTATIRSDIPFESLVSFYRPVQRYAFYALYVFYALKCFLEHFRQNQNARYKASTSAA